MGIESTKTDSIKFYPFSTGPRNWYVLLLMLSCCNHTALSLGRKLALLEMRIVIINLYNRFKFQRVEDEYFQREPVIYMTLNPQSIIMLPIARTP